MDSLYEISKEAENDWYRIVGYTLKNFGAKQVQKYAIDLLKCLDDLAKGIEQVKELNVSGHLVLIRVCQYTQVAEPESSISRRTHFWKPRSWLLSMTVYKRSATPILGFMDRHQLNTVKNIIFLRLVNLINLY